MSRPGWQRLIETLGALVLTPIAVVVAGFSLAVSLTELVATVEYGILGPHGQSLLIAPYVGLAFGAIAGTRLGRFAAYASALSLLFIGATDVLLSSHRGRGPLGEEAQAIGDVRSLVSAQETFANVNGGFYSGELECLSEPDRCLSGLPDTFPDFLGSDITRLGVKSGYARTFQPGPAAELPPDGKRTDGGPLSPASVTSYAYFAVRVVPFKEARNICGDSTGMVCYTDNGALPVVEAGRCVQCTRQDSGLPP